MVMVTLRDFIAPFNPYRFLAKEKLNFCENKQNN